MHSQQKCNWNIFNQVSSFYYQGLLQSPYILKLEDNSSLVSSFTKVDKE